MDKYYNGQFLTKSARLSKWDYGSNGKYFVTICTRDQKNYFGEIQNGSMIMSEIGEFTRQCWEEIPDHHPFIDLETFIIMPNHIHGIILIGKTDKNKWTQNKFGPQSQNLGAVIRDFKAAVTRHARKHSIDFQWQARYHDRIIRNDQEMEQIRDYILNNPLRWDNYHK